VDLGKVGKVRPCVILTDLPGDDELALITIVLHTTSLKGNQWELAIPKPFLSSKGAFHFQQIQSITLSRLIRRLGRLSDAEWDLVLDKLAARLSL
jgi:mRNA interferase MazF